MRKLLASAMLVLLVAGSTFGPLSGVALAQGDTMVDQPVVDESWLTNQSHTLDATQSNGSVEANDSSAPSAPSAPPGCSCAVIHGEDDAI